MKRTTKVAIGAAAAVGALMLLSAGLAQAASTDGLDSNEKETSITGSALEKASAAALAYTGGGTVTATEVGDEESLYEVEITLDDGREVDVQLDERFAIVEVPSDADTDD